MEALLDPGMKKRLAKMIDYSKYRGAKSVWEEFEKPILIKKGLKIEEVDIKKPKCN